MARTCRLILAALVASLLLAAVARSQQPASEPATRPAAATEPATTAATGPATAPAATAPSTAPATATGPAAVPVPRPADRWFIPLADVPAAADRAVRDVRTVEAALAADAAAGEVANDLPGLSAEVDARLQETAQLLAGRASLEALRGQEAAWEEHAGTLAGWQRDLTRDATQLNRHVDAMADLAENWWGPNLRYQQSAAAPPEVVRRMESILATVARTREAATAARGRVLGLQARVSEEAGRAADALASVRAARAGVVNRVLVRDSPPIWAAVADPGQGLAAGGQRTFGAQVAALEAYVARRAGTLALHGLALVLLTAALVVARRRVRPWAQGDESVRRAAVVFQTPVATATLLALLASRQLYPSAPRLFWAVVGAGALVPTIVILRRLMERRLFAVLDALVVFYAVDQARAVAAVHPLLARLLLLGELAGGAAFLVWLLRSGRLSHAVGGAVDPLGRAIVVMARIGGMIFVAAFVAAALGYVTLATLLGNATLGSAYLAVILYAATRVADGLVMAALRVRPLRLLKTVERHRTQYWRRAGRAARWGAVVLWVVVTLDMLSVRGIVGGWLDAVWAFGVSAGAFSLTVGQLVTFVLTVWAAVLISRFVRFFLEEDVYPRLHLARGLPYAVSTVLHYAILVVGFVAAVGALGYDMTKFSILAGAFGVGLGFGLQNIFNNFVSGLILLFERPIKVGDVIQIGPDVGTVRRIGIRASIVRTANGAEIILPNARLIADPVTNWTLSGHGRGIEVPIGVAPGTEPRQVMLLWRRVTADHPKVAEDPPPRAAMVGVAADALRFELHAWTTEFESWAQTRSDLAVAMTAALGEAGIAVR